MLIKKRYLILKTFRVEGYYDCVDTEYYETTHKMRMYTNEFCSSLLQGNYLEGNVDLSSGRIEMYDAVEFGLAFTYDNNIDVIYMFLMGEEIVCVKLHKDSERKESHTYILIMILGGIVLLSGIKIQKGQVLSTEKHL